MRSIVMWPRVLVVASAIAACGGATQPPVSNTSSHASSGSGDVTTSPADPANTPAAPASPPAPRPPTPVAPSPLPGGLAISSVAPEKGDAAGGTYVVLKGQRFVKDGPRSLKVYFGSRQGTVVRFQSDTEVIVQAPGGKPGEVVDILVIFDPGGQLALKQAFMFVDRN
jgi:hypothetical protein